MAVQYDAQGRPYVLGANGQRTYLSPQSVATSADPRARAFAESSQRPDDNFFRGSQWDQNSGEWDRTWNMGNIGSLAIGGYLGGVAAPAVFGGGGGAAAAPGAQVGNLNATIDSLMAGGAGGAGGGLGTVAATSATGGGATIADRVRRALTDPATIATAGTVIASMLGNRGGGSYDDQIAANQDQLRRLQAITEARMRRVDPLHQAATQLAFGRLPVSSREGLTLTNTPLPE